MTIMNAEEIISVICDNEDMSVQQFVWDDYFKDNEQIKKLGDFKCVDEVSKTTGYAHKVYHFKDHGVYILIKGWYNSYSGDVEYDESGASDCEEVTPQQETITVYK